jgi:hypothetical protein
VPDASKKPLYRKVNTQTHGVPHAVGGDYRTDRTRDAASDASRGAMHGRARRGRDYTPLFRFLLSKVGQPWDDVFREAVGRLDDREPIWWMVSLNCETAREIVRLGESSYFSGLFVDDEGILRAVNPDLKAADLSPSCTCCTHTFNGERFGTQAGSPDDVSP